MEWMIAFFSVVGTIANIKQKWWGFAIWMVTNGAWVIIDILTGAYAQAAMFSIYFGLAVWGMISWIRNKKKKRRIKKNSCRYRYFIPNIKAR